MKELLFKLTDSSGVQVTLDHAPDGWDEAMIITERSKKYHGIFRSFTIPLKFIKDGAEILRTEFYTYGLAATCSLVVQKLNKTTMTYYTAYTGKLDFATFKDHDYAIEITSVDGNLAQIIKSRETDEVEFTYTDYDSSLKVITRFDGTINPGYTVGSYCMTVFQVFGAIMDKITDGGITAGTYHIKSDFLSTSGGGIWNKYYLTTVSSIKYPGSSVHFTFKTTLADFFKSIDSLWCLGMGIETIGGYETIRIEKREYFYPFSPSVIYDVGKSKNITVGLLADFIFNKIKVGYPNMSYSDTPSSGNGTANILEPNTETVFQVPSLSGKEYDIVSKYRADYQGIKALFNTETEDTKDTDLVFMRLKNTDVGGGTYYWLLINGRLRKNGDPAVVETPGNMDISPRRMLTAHQFFLNGCCYGLNGQMIEFQSGTNDQANNQTAVSATGAFENEYDPLEIREDFTWFRPIEINIDAAYPADFINLIAANPYGVIEFEYKKNTYKGYILKMETKLSGAGSVKYSLLSFRTNDLTKLIR